MDKNILKRFAVESRKELKEKIETKIKKYFVDEEFKVIINGDIYSLVNEKHTLILTKREYEDRCLLIKRIKEITLEQVIEEAAYTWFNRIIAIRYMEIHDYLPLTKDNQSLGIRALSSRDNEPDPEIMKFSNLTNPELDIGLNKSYYMTLKDDNKKFEYILLLICKKLGKVIPQVFDGVTDYIDLLIPDNLLNESGYITKVLRDVPEENYNEVEIIGWLYQYYNQEEKDRVMAQNRAYKKDEIAYVTQLFTPNWIVKYMVENSLGKYWIENNGDETLISKWEFFIKDNVKYNKKGLKPENLTFIDPCCGSGHILVYAFEVFFQIYQSMGYNKREIPVMILKNNIYGLDIDDRAGQLSVLSVLLKAREYDKDIFNNEVISNLNILSIQDSNNINNIDILNLTKEENVKLQYLIQNFSNGKDIGSLLILDEKDYTRLEQKIRDDDTIFGLEIKSKVLPLIKIAKMLTKKYDIVVTNPPYLTNKNMNKVLQTFVNKNYESSKRDLYSCFIKKCGNLTKPNGIYSMITIHTWMFLAAFKKIRSEVIKDDTILSMIHLGAGVFKEINTFNVLATAFTIKKTSCDDYYSLYIRLVDYANEEEKISNMFNNNNYYKCNQNDFREIQDNIFLYYLSNNMLNILNKEKSIGDLFRIKPGITTSNNARFVRNWYEIDVNKIGFNLKSREESIKAYKKWFPYNNGGNYRKWYGNNEAVVDWENDGENIKNYKLRLRENNPGFNIGIAALNDIFKKGLTYSIFGFRNFGIRYKDYGFIFDVSGASIFTDNENEYYLLGYLASKVSFAFLSAIAPTVNFQAGDISSIPYIYKKEYKEQIEMLVKKNIEISKNDWDSFEISWDFNKHPLIQDENNIEESFEKWERLCVSRFDELKNNEIRLNKLFMEIYGLTKEISSDVDDSDITVRLANRERDIKSLISYAVGCMFGRYSLDQDGLVYAGGDFDEAKYNIFKADKDNVIPITNEAYFGDDIVSKFKKFIEIVYGKETLNENMNFIAETLGKRNDETDEDTIRRYFINDFYNDHIKIYQKKPIYWLFDSGKKNGFKCLIYMHRYDEQTVARIRLDYLHRMQNVYEKMMKNIEYRLQEDLSIQDKKTLLKQQSELIAKLQEINEYDERIAHIANQRINIDLDDGVTVNYNKFVYKNPKTGKDESILGKIK